jgi:hypothetical protein
MLKIYSTPGNPGFPLYLSALSQNGLLMRSSLRKALWSGVLKLKENYFYLMAERPPLAPKVTELHSSGNTVTTGWEDTGGCVCQS